MTRDELSRHQREVRAQRYLYIGMAAVVGFAFLILALGWWREVVSRGSESVATAAGKSITLESYAKRLDFQRQVMDQQIQLMQAQLAASDNELVSNYFRQQIQQAQLSQSFLPDQTLDLMIGEELVRQEAARRGIQVSDQDVDKEIQATFGDQPTPTTGPAPTTAPGATPQPTRTPAPSATPGPSPTPAPTADVPGRINNFLLSYGMTRAEFRSLFEAQLLTKKVEEAIGAEVPRTAEQVHARHILVENEDKAKEIRAKLAAGASFEELAKAESTDPGSKAKDGDLGWFPKGAMVPEFEAAAFQLPLKQVSEPVKSTYGYHLIEVLEKEQNRPLDEQMLEQRKASAYNDWLDKARNGPDVKRSLTDGQKQWVYSKIKWTPPNLPG